MSKSTEVYIIIVTYNAIPWIQQCLQSCIEYPVVVVDNNSTDKTVAYIKENFPKVHLLPQKENLGFGQGNNLGIRYAMEQGAGYVFLLNQDAYVQEGCIEKLIAVHKKNSEFGVISPVHFNGAGTTLDSNFLLFLHRYKVAGTILSDMFKKTENELYPTEFVNAAAWLVSRDCLEKVGGFDPLFFHYGEDRNYCQRVAYHGFKIGIIPTAAVYHDREDRPEKKIEKFSKAYYKEFERYLKVDWADVNLQEFEKKYNNRSRYLLSKCFRYLTQLNFKMAKDVFIKRKILLQLEPELLKSRQESESKKPSYFREQKI